MQDEICTRVCRCAATAWNISPNQIDKNSSMDTIPKWDSLGHLKLIMALEKEFGVALHSRDTVRMRSIENICQIIEAVKGN